ncbi:MAG: hypothetical protein PHV13_01605 [Candidatus ainarchaeum sp.]|nr:hypothetical protein [Candidatus ainarchaeum sp.]
MNKKGFLFTVTVFLILTYILLSISVWVKGVEASERAYSEFYKESTVELAIEQITPAKVDDVTNIVMNRALFRLNGNSIDHPVKEGAADDENAYISKALYGLLVNGTAPSSCFQDSAAMADDGSSLTAWMSNLNASLLSIGVYVSEFSVSNFRVWQGDIDTVNYSFDMGLRLNDYSNTSAVVRTYHLNNAVGISGLADPALARESRNLIDGPSTAYRQFFFNKSLYASPDRISVRQLSTGQAGQGWLYAYLASASGPKDLVPSAAELDMSQRRNYILVGSFSEITSLTPGVYEAFAGYIITDGPGYQGECIASKVTNKNEVATFNPIRYSGDSCTVDIDPGAGAPTSKPFILAHDFDASAAPECPIFAGNATARGRCALITSRYLPEQIRADPLKKLDSSASAIYGVEAIRDFVMCGYYTQNPAAPSYFQRLMPDSYSRNSTLGIETFVIGQYANSTNYDLNSRLDRELFNASIDGIKIMGLPGCKTYESCADTPSTGIFAISQQTVSAYGLGQLACSGSRCG